MLRLRSGRRRLTFIKRIENLDYIDAVRFLADRAGMKMPENDVNDATSRLRTRVLEANREAARLFHTWLYGPEGKVGLDYYHSRGYTDHTIRRFGLGLRRIAIKRFGTLCVRRASTTKSWLPLFWRNAAPVLRVRAVCTIYFETAS